MSFDSNDYLKWYLPRLRSEDHPINLHASGMPAIDLTDIEVFRGDPWTFVPLFERKLAQWLGIDEGEICFTPGATGGTLLALLTLAGPGDELLVESPIYEPMLRQACRLNRVKRFKRRMEDGWKLPLEEINDLITDETAVVMITDPFNPSGTFADRQSILKLAETAADHDAYLLINEVYLKFTDASSFHGEADNIVVVSSLSKLLGTYSLRLGWLSASSGLIGKLKGAHMNMGMPTLPAAAYGLGVLKKAQELRRRATLTASTGVDTVDTWVKSQGEVNWLRPAGPGFGCLSSPSIKDNDIEFATRLCDEQGVLVIPGTHFEFPGTLRLSWLQSGDNLEEGLELLGKALER